MGSKRRWIGSIGRSVGTARGRNGAREYTHREKCPRPVPVRQRSPTCLDDHQCVCMYAFTRFARECEVFRFFFQLCFWDGSPDPQEFVSRARRLDIVSCWVPCTMFSADTSASPTVLASTGLNSNTPNLFMFAKYSFPPFSIPCQSGSTSSDSAWTCFFVFLAQSHKLCLPIQFLPFSQIRFLRAEVILARNMVLLTGSSTVPGLTDWSHSSTPPFASVFDAGRTSPCDTNRSFDSLSHIDRHTDTRILIHVPTHMHILIHVRRFLLARLMCCVRGCSAMSSRNNRKDQPRLRADSRALQPTSTPSVPLAVIQCNQHRFLVQLSAWNE